VFGSPSSRRRFDFDSVVYWDVDRERERQQLSVDRVSLLFTAERPPSVYNEGLEELRAKLTRDGVSTESMRLWTRDSVVAYKMVAGELVLAPGTKRKKIRLFRRIAKKLDLPLSPLGL